MDLHGRTVIRTSVEEITSENILDVLNTAITVHQENVAQIDYLYDYYLGITDVQDRTKTYNDYVLNKINENRAKEIVDFKTSYLVGEDVVYSTGNEENSENIELLNQLMKLCSKSTKDYSLVEWQMICGTAYRAVLPVTEEVEEGDSPFTIDIPDPRQAFVIYSSGIHGQPLACVFMVTDDEGITHYWTYTHDKCFRTNDADESVKSEEWTLNYLPIIEYPANNARTGAFELVIPLLNAIDELDSSRLDAVQMFVQSLLVLVNCKLPEGMGTKELAENGLLELVSNSDNPASVEMLCNELNQQQTQTLKDDFYDAVLTICAMPSRSGGGSTSDNGIAVIYRDGWSAAETASKTSQTMIKQSEYQALRLVLAICRETGTLDIPLRDISIDFTRNHYENLELKTTVLIQLLNNEKVHPLVAYEVCGLFADPNEKYRMGMDWYEQNQGVEDDTATETGDTELPIEV